MSGRRRTGILLAVVAVLAIAPASAGASELLGDPGFESSTGNPPFSPSWTEADSFFSSPICGCPTDALHAPRTGSKWVDFGSSSGAHTASMEQSVTIPSGNTPVTASWYWWVSVAGAGNDSLTVKFDGSTVATYTSANIAGGYAQGSTNVSSAADGGTHTIRFEYVNTSGAESSINLDDVSILNSTTPAAPTGLTVTPASGSNDNNPKIKGSADVDTTTVQLYTDSGCTTPIGSSTAVATFTGAGIPVSVANNSSTDFYAKATGPGGDSPCSTDTVHYNEISSVAAVAHVTNSGDTGAGSLRKALGDVNPGGEVVFDVPTADPVLATQITINRNVTITGLGAGTTRTSCGPGNRAFELAPGISVTIRDLEITGCNAPDGANGATPGDTSDPGEAGGAILNGRSNSSLTLQRTRIDANNAGTGGNGAAGDMDDNGTAGADGGSGGAIWSEGTLVVEDSEISGNHAGNGGSAGSSGGPAVGADGADGGEGGGIAGTGSVTITDSTLSANFAGDGGNGAGGSTSGDGGDGGTGGGLSHDGGGALTLTNVTISGNEAGDGGAHGVGGSPGNLGGNGGYGGGLFTSSAATVTNATIAGNTAGTGQPGSSFMIPPPFITPPVHGVGGGVSGPATLNNTIVASNNAPGSDRNCDSAVLDGDYNISFPDIPEQGCPAGFDNGDPLLGPLALNSPGSTPTMAITAMASAAFDHVPTAGGCPTTDQRGVTRPQFSQCDAGAYELAASPPSGGGGGGTTTAPGNPTSSTNPAGNTRKRKCKKKKRAAAAKKKCKKKK